MCGNPAVSIFSATYRTDIKLKQVATEDCYLCPELGKHILLFPRAGRTEIHSEALTQTHLLKAPGSHQSKITT